MTSPVLEALISLFLLIGGIFALIGSIGLARLPDLFTGCTGRPRPPPSASAASSSPRPCISAAEENGLSLHELLVTLFLFVTAPVSAYLIARAALHLGESSGPRDGS